MDKFKNQLFDDLMQEHGTALAVAEPPEPRRNTRPAWVAAGAVALAGATFATVSLTSSGTPAFAITKSPDGTVVVEVPDEAGIDPANRELERQGLPIRVVRSRPGCPPLPGPPAHKVDVRPAPLEPAVTDRPGIGWRINLADIYPGETALLMRSRVTEAEGGFQVFAFEMLAAGVPVPACVYREMKTSLPSLTVPPTTPR